jgi:hypothetical protein
MISIEDRKGLVIAAVFGQFTIDDYKRFEEAVSFHIKFDGHVDLLMDLRDMTGFTLDVAWEELKFNRAHPNDFRRVGIVTQSQWVAWSAWLSRAFVNAEVEVFESFELASDWVGSAS